MQGHRSMTFDGPELLELSPQRDARGFFVEIHNRPRPESPSATPEFVQDNLSVSRQWVVRGLHYQIPPDDQGKLVQVVKGAVFDVAVDIRRSSPDYGRWWGQVLDDSLSHQIWIPPGFAHGFLSLEDDTRVLYKVTGHHAPQSERRIRWDDPGIGIAWPLEGRIPILSDADRGAPLLDQAEVFD
jgi:dTDP-4-dehydrorhamnose 3,5-epimerase